MRVRNKNQFKTRIDDLGRVCTACLEYKKWGDFIVASKSATGRTSICRDCKRVNAKPKNRTRENYSASKRKKWLRKNRPYTYRSRNIRSSLMSRALRAEMDRSEIPTAEEIEIWLTKQSPLKCYYSGEPLDILKLNVDHKTPLSRGGGNNFDNLCVTSHAMNSAKGQMTDTEFFELLNLIKKWDDGGQYILVRLRQGFMGKKS